MSTCKLLWKKNFFGLSNLFWIELFYHSFSSTHKLKFFLDFFNSVAMLNYLCTYVKPYRHLGGIWCNSFFFSWWALRHAARGQGKYVCT
jgi:hypothetical protein